MRDWDWGAIWRNFRLVRLGLIALTAISGAWLKHAKSDAPDPRMAAAILQAYSEEVGFKMPPEYQIRRVPRGQTAFVVRPDGQRMSARTANVGSLTHRLYADVVAAGAEDPGQEQGTREAMDALREEYGQDLGPDDQLAVLPPGWGLSFSR